MRFNVDKTLTKIKSFLDLDTQDPQFIGSDQSDFFQTFIHDLVKRRNALSWSLETIAEKTGLPITMLEGMEQGAVLPASEMQVYANSLGLSFQLVEIIPLEDLILKQSTTEIISSLRESEIAIGDSGKYITKDPVTKAIMECSQDGELVGPLSLTHEVMQTRWRVVKHADPMPDHSLSESPSQNELEKEIFVNIVYSDLNYNQLRAYLANVQDKIQDEELSQMIHQLCHDIDRMTKSETTSIDSDPIYKDIRQSKERIVEYFFKGIHLRNQE